MDNDSIPEPCSREEKNFESQEILNKNEESDDYRGRNRAQTRMVSDETIEEYEDGATGIKLVYDLTLGDVKRYIRHGKPYKEQRRASIKYASIQIFLFLVLFGGAYISGAKNYLIASLIPLFSLGIIWFISSMNVRASAKRLLNDTHFMIDVFPDRLEIKNKFEDTVLNLDGSYKSDEYKDLIMIFRPGKSGIIIPLKAVDPDMRAEIQAMILSGCTPI